MLEAAEKLLQGVPLTHADFVALLEAQEALTPVLLPAARTCREQIYGKDVYIRGLIEISNICKNDCRYCGIRKSNCEVSRYRLLPEQILHCCEEGYVLGFRTFVMQGGEDGAFSDEILCPLIREIKTRYPDCAVTLSIGERSRESYQCLFDAGADRFLLRHETVNPKLYAQLHPQEMSLENRLTCLRNLKEIGYQVGTGFMVGVPGQTRDDLAAELCYIAELRPQMVGIGPFIPHHTTQYANEPAGSAALTCYLLAILRLLLPHVLLPATTALNTVAADGRILGMLAGANVVMPNLSPASVRESYQLYDNKKSTGQESAQAVAALRSAMQTIGYTVVTARGDYAGNGKEQACRP